MANYAARFYRYAMVDVRAVQSQLMDQSIAAVMRIEQLVLSLLNNPSNKDASQVDVEVTTLLTDTVHAQADLVVSRWQKLLYELITRYHDGYSAENLDKEDIYMKKLFYPKSWLDATGFWNSKPNDDPDALLFATGEEMISEGQCHGQIFQIVFWTAVVSSLVTFLSMWLSQRYSRNSSKGYVTVGPGVYMPVDEL